MPVTQSDPDTMALIQLHNLPSYEADENENENENFLPNKAGLRNEELSGSERNLVRVDFLWPTANDKYPDAEDPVSLTAIKSSGQGMPKLKDAVFVEYSYDFALPTPGSNPRYL